MLAIIFPGQGAQKSGMGKDFFDTCPVAKRTYEEANEILGWDMSNVCFSRAESELLKTHLTQIAVFVTEIAIFNSIKELGIIHPSFFAGHSLGEYSALVASGALSFADGLRLVYKRGQLMTEASQNSHGMLAVTGASINKVKTLCEEFNDAGYPLDLACYNAPEQSVIAGEKAVLSKANELLSTWGVRTAYLKVSGAFHSRWMHEISNKYRYELEKVSWKKMKNAVIANVNGMPYPEENYHWSNLLVRQLVEPVNWVKTIRFLYSKGVGRFLEIGPGCTLSQLTRSIIPSIESHTVSSISDMEEGLSFALKTSPDSIGMAFIAKSLAFAAATRNSENILDFDNECRKPYLEVLNIYNNAQDNSMKVDEIACRKSALMLEKIFMKKNISLEEQYSRWQELSWLDSFDVISDVIS